MKKEDLRKVEFKDPKLYYTPKSKKENEPWYKGHCHMLLKEVMGDGSEAAKAVIEKENGEMVQVFVSDVRFIND